MTPGALRPLSKTPLVSVVVPAYNMAELTRLTVESLLAQSHPKVEVVVVDDGSTDDTPRLMEAFGTRIRFARQANAGACAARNHGFRLSRGELVAFLDCDDLWEPHKARRCVDFFEARPAAGMVYSHAYWIDAAGRVVGPRSFAPRPAGRIFDTLALEDHVMNSTPVLRREAFERAGGWDESIFTTADWDLWLKIARDFEVGFIPEVLSRTRIASHYNARNIERTRRETLYLFDKHGIASRPDLRSPALANMHHYLSRLFALNGDFASALDEAREAARLGPRGGRRSLALFAYRLGPRVNRMLSRLWECYTLLSCRWNILRQGARVHPVESGASPR